MVGRGATASRDTPSAAARPIRAGVSTCPVCITRSPARTSLPAKRTAEPGLGVVRNRTLPSRSSASSLGITVSAPSGSGAPVVMRRHCPALRVPAQRSPANCSPTSCNAASPAATSACRSAKPSIALLANGGSASGAIRSPAEMRPSAREVAMFFIGRTVAGRNSAQNLQRLRVRNAGRIVGHVAQDTSAPLLRKIATLLSC